MDALILKPITPSDSICQTLTCVQPKFMVDMVNCLDVARDHIAVQKRRSGFLARLYDGFTGQGQRRQAQVNQNLATSLEAVVQHLGEIDQVLEHSNYALQQVNERVSHLSRHMAQLVHYSADTREQLQTLATHVQGRMDAMEAELARIGRLQSARVQLDAVFSRWSMGKLAQLPLAARCYAVTEELRWGAFGDCLRHRETSQKTRDDLRDMAQARVMEQLGRDLGKAPGALVEMEPVWLAHVSDSEQGKDLLSALAYMADGMSVHSAPMVNSVVCQQRMDDRVPIMMSSKSLAGWIMREVFPRQWQEVTHG